MASSLPLASTDPDDLATMIRPVGGDVVVTGRGTFRSQAVRLDFNRLWMQHVEEELPRIWHSAASSTRAAIWFLTQPGSAITFQGAEVRTREIGICPVGQPIWQRLTGPSSWGSVSLSLEDWDAVSTVAETDPFSSSAGMVLTPRTPGIERLQRLHRSIARLAHNAPELIHNTEVARGLEQSLIHAMVECLLPPENGRIDVSVQRRSVIMRRFRDVLDDCCDASIYVPELCARLGVPSRTLRAICHEYLGIGPKKYLLLRRMHLARRALRIGDPAKTTVTDIATQFGFWQLGRFAVDYKALFGESPSSTLLQ